jgi:hypothetical protein
MHLPQRLTYHNALNAMIRFIIVGLAHSKLCDSIGYTDRKRIISYHKLLLDSRIKLEHSSRISYKCSTTINCPMACQLYPKDSLRLLGL